MSGSMEGFMAKKLERVSKGVEMQIEQQMRAMLWEAVPPLITDNRKSWLARAARSLGWGQRRTKALFYCEARVVTAEEWKTINERLNAAKLRERQMAERENECRLYRGGMGESMPVDPREDLPLPLAASPSTSSAATRRSAGRPAEPHSEE
jgi:hypothetical protein